MATRHWLQLALTRGLGPILTRRLIASTETTEHAPLLGHADRSALVEVVGSAEAACAASEKSLRKIEGIGSKKADDIFRAMRAAADLVDGELEKAAKLGVTIVSPDDESYPLLLRSIPDPPAVLYVKGVLEPRDLNGLAIVGSRKCSYYGREQSERFAALLAGAGFTIVSGGARGTDLAAHRGALTHPQGRTIAVLGSGVDVPYPPENEGLFEQIARRGAVMSEFPFGTPPMADNFPRRNRIVSGLSRGVLVTEAAERSGALITARQACDDHGRPVFALPGRVDNPMSAGPHKLIRDGAILVTKLEEILEGLGPLPAEAHELPAAPEEEQVVVATIPGSLNLSERQSSILEQLKHEPMKVDRLMEHTGLEASVVLRELTFLTLKGQVKRLEGQTFARTR